MKQIIPHLKMNQKVWALIEEVLEENHLIVSFQGDLIRVQNESGRRFRPGQRIQLIVKALEPLELRLLENRSPGINYSRHLDLDI